jgi:hypothetical protein
MGEKVMVGGIKEVRAKGALPDCYPDTTFDTTRPFRLEKTSGLWLLGNCSTDVQKGKMVPRQGLEPWTN